MSYHLGRIEMVANTDTFIDLPYHFPAEAANGAELPLEQLVDVLVVVIRASGPTAIGSEILKRRYLSDPVRLSGKAVLVHTGWSRHWGTPGYLPESPYLTRDFAEALEQRRRQVLRLVRQVGARECGLACRQDGDDAQAKQLAQNQAHGTGEEQTAVERIVDHSQTMADEMDDGGLGDRIQNARAVGAQTSQHPGSGHGRYDGPALRACGMPAGHGRRFRHSQHAFLREGRSVSGTHQIFTHSGTPRVQRR
jgi:kynurenine formamidase